MSANPPEQDSTSITGALQDMERRYELLFGLNPDPLFAFDPQGRLLDGNAALEVLTGCTRRELLNRPLLDFVAAEERERVARHFARAVRGEAQSFEMACVSSDGRDFVMATTLLPTILDGVVEGVYGIGRDVTRMREAERALHEVEERYSILADNAQDMMSLHDTRGTFLYASPSASRLLGYHPVELVGRSVYDIIEPDDVASLRAAHEAIMQRETQPPVVVRAHRRDGSLRWFEATARLATREGTGEPWRIVAVTRDITERRAFEQHLLQSQKMEALGRLAAGIAHDFNNMLTVIGGHAEMLAQQFRGTPAATSADHIREATSRATMLTHQLMGFGRGSAQELRVLDMNAVLLEAQPLFVRLLDPHVQLSLELAPELDAVRSEPAAIEQVLMNLVVNARDAMPDGGRVTIRTRNRKLPVSDPTELQPGHYVLITVTDTGPGMPPEVATHAFEPFFTTKSGVAGAGLGLSTAYTIVRESGGDIALDTGVGRGTTLSVLLPAVDEPAVMEVADKRAAERLEGTETVLLAEDDAGVRSLIVAILQRYGYNVMTAVDGRQAIELFRVYGHLVDMVITDVNMPEATGVEFADEIAAAGATVPVLFISGFSKDTLPFGNSADRQFLAKPFTPEDLARRVRRMLTPVR